MAIIKNITTNELVGISDPGPGNFVAVMQNVSVTRDTAGAAISFGAGQSQVHVHGVVSAAAGAGISMGATTPATGGNNKVIVSSSGGVFGNGGAGVTLSGDGNSILNAGMIASAGSSAILMDGNNGRIVNSGTIMGLVGVNFTAGLLSSVNVLENYGLISGQGNGSGNAVQSGSGIDNILNRGTIGGDVSLFNSEDSVDNIGGIITGLISLGGGDDQLLGGDSREKADGGTGADTIEFAGGNDRFMAGNNEEASTDDNDDLDGGDGVDTYDASAISSNVNISLQELRASGAAIGIDLVLNFENITGGTLHDTLTGDAQRNVINGNAGADSIVGLAGNDKLIGGAGGDTLIGGSGRDVMVGGLNADVFDYNAFTELGTNADTRDIIRDFAVGSDKIDLTTIDAGAAVGDQAFAFVGAFTNVAGQLRVVVNTTTKITVVEIDSTGDGAADFQIQLSGAPALTASDFNL